MQITKTVPVSQRKQLIDLNGETVNFDITFTATSKNSEPFEIIVVDQDTLDKKPDLEFKKVNGSISGNIISDKDLYQNYYICLKAANPCDVDVVVDKKEIVPVKQPTPNVQPKKILPPIKPPDKSSINWKAISIFILVVGGSIILYYMYFNKNSSTNFKFQSSMYNNENNPNIPKTTIPEITTKTTTPKAPGPTHNDTYTNFGLGRKANDSLISRLNSLPLK